MRIYHLWQSSTYDIWDYLSIIYTIPFSWKLQYKFPMIWNDFVLSSCLPYLHKYKKQIFLKPENFNFISTAATMFLISSFSLQ